MEPHWNYQTMLPFLLPRLDIFYCQKVSVKSNLSTYFYGLHSASLIYLGQICDNWSIAILDKSEINVLKGSKLIPKGHWNRLYVVWNIPISNPLWYWAHAIITIDQTNTELIYYLHWWLSSPMPRTFLNTIRNINLLTWNGLINPKLLKHLPFIIATALGNIDQEQKYL